MKFTILKKFGIFLVRNLFSDFRRSVITITITSFLAGGTVFIFCKKLWLVIVNVLQFSVPVWLLIITYIAFAYVIKRIRSPAKAISINPDTYKLLFIEAYNYKWRTKVYKNYFFEVEKVPICIIHDLSFVYLSGESLYGETFLCCPECKKSITSNDLNDFHEIAKSYIDKKIRNNKIGGEH